MIDINDYKMIYHNKIKVINRIWIIVLIFVIIGIIFINKSFKYYEYYSNIGEYEENNLKIYALIKDINKITKNENIIIDNEKFAYKVDSISKDNIFLNNNYYKEIRLQIEKKEIIDNEIVDIKIIINSSSLLEYVFKTVWR